MKKNFYIIITVVVISVLLVCFLGIFLSKKNNLNKKNINNDNSYVLEDWEKDLLLNDSNRTLTESERKSIESGNLTTTQELKLKNLRNVATYLGTKYPNYNWKIISFGHEGILGDSISVYNFTVEGFSKTYRATSTDNINFTDDFEKDIIEID